MAPTDLNSKCIGQISTEAMSFANKVAREGVMAFRYYPDSKSLACLPSVENVCHSFYRVFSRRVGGHVGVPKQIKRTIAILLSSFNPPGIEFYSYSNALFCFG